VVCQSRAQQALEVKWSDVMDNGFNLEIAGRSAHPVDTSSEQSAMQC